MATLCGVRCCAAVIQPDPTALCAHIAHINVSLVRMRAHSHTRAGITKLSPKFVRQTTRRTHAHLHPHLNATAAVACEWIESAYNLY